ncbi:MAG: ATP-dependent RecD-like DNA helicase, partial [Candidatus Sumerlaeia bacterium]
MARKSFYKKPAPPQPSGEVPPGEQVLRGSLTRFTFQSQESGFVIARFVSDKEGGGLKKEEECVITGNLTGVEAGESVEIRGMWTRNPKFGIQFAVDSFKQIPPSSAEGIRAFLGSGMIAGIGKEYANRIVEAFGDKTLEVIDREPKRLKEVEGIGPKRYGKIVESWQEHRAIAEIMSFLQSYGISATWASRIYKYYGDKAVTLMRENPYRLAIDLRGMGFKSADKIAQTAGVAPDSPERIQAGILHILRDEAGNGHTFYDFDQLSEQAQKLLEVNDPAAIRNATAELCKDDAGPQGALAVAEKLPEGDKAVYLRGLHHAETNVAEYLTSLIHTGKSLPRMDIEREIDDFERATKFQLADRQREAVRLALRGGVMVITGGPGTGKTTTLRAVIHVLRRKQLALNLCAPTGRAAKRLSESTHMDARTIHRLLKWDPKKGGFAYNDNFPLPTDYLVVDEASMLDISLMHQLLKAMPPTASLLLVGDVDQLPSVGPGNVLRDIMESGRAPTVRLDTIFRQARQSLIVVNAHRVNEGEFPIIKKDASDPKMDFFFVDREDPEEAVQAIEELVSKRIPDKYKLDPIQDIQIITPMHRGALGAGNLNMRLQALLNQDPRSISRGNVNFKVGDKVMQFENDYDKDVFNGDIGTIADIDRLDHNVRIRFDRRLVDYPFSDLDEINLSYAITVHKSQGSEYPVVILPIHTQHYIMLQRNLLYTAITRGRKLVVCVGAKRALSIAINN